ncbi:hypothetical protein PoB_006820800 [Plakobranchus ocellatus]|uniref:Uncharacterized protein n=1 Tax=Plakobranchus ocellatus TaxID=259542 RepID=A0AAV4DBW9_9GAST|nr:hypothetical protein PoB_006820800 [Plakobranchus ocellatus]
MGATREEVYQSEFEQQKRKAKIHQEKEDELLRLKELNDLLYMFSLGEASQKKNSNQPTTVPSDIMCQQGFWFLYIASPQQGNLRLLGPLSGQGAGGGARTRNSRVPADLRADSLTTQPPTPLLQQSVHAFFYDFIGILTKLLVFLPTLPS